MSTERRRGKLGRPRKYPKHVEERARELWDAGFSYEQIADDLEVPPDTIRYWFNRDLIARRNLAGYHRRQAEQRRAETPKVARQVGGSVAEIYSRLRRLLAVWDGAIAAASSERTKAELRDIRALVYQVEDRIGQVLRDESQ